jgi:hypothetical protein
LINSTDEREETKADEYEEAHIVDNPEKMIANDDTFWSSNESKVEDVRRSQSRRKEREPTPLESTTG